MHDYLLSTEWVRFAFVTGIAVSMLLYERRHLTTGSIVVPGYIAVFLLHPLILVATFLNAFVTYALVNRVLRRYVLLYGRTKFTVLAVTSTVVQTVLVYLTPSGRWLWEQEIAFFIGAGYIVPALIAHDMARQGIKKTATSVLLAGSIVAVPITAALVLDLPGVNDLAPVGGYGRLAFPSQWLPIAIVISIVASWAVARNYDSRSGGFIGAAFIGMFMADVWQIVAALSIASISYLVVTKLLMTRMILFGRRKFSAMLLVSAAISWPALWVGASVLGADQLAHVGVGSLALTPLLLPGLLANDAQRTAPGRVLLGVAVAATCTVTTTWWIGATLTGQHLETGWKAVSASTLLLLLWPQFRQSTGFVAGRIEHVAANRGPRERLRQTWADVRVVSQGLTQSFATVSAATFFPAPAPVFARLAAPPARNASWTTFERAHPDQAADATQWLERALAEPPQPTSSAGTPVGSAATTRQPRSAARRGRASTWPAFERAHPDVAADARRWLDESLPAPPVIHLEPIVETQPTLAHDVVRPEPSPPGPPTEPTPRPEQRSELERVARDALSRLLGRSPHTLPGLGTGPGPRTTGVPGDPLLRPSAVPGAAGDTVEEHAPEPAARSRRLADTELR